ncbi:hypothetical protein [Microbacterium sp. bgisy189]|uniref:hypothetical protein n=1 Tax=Microbacterium sp. bgisy189 TaxID=3413798 RepID=UPI003EBFA907
MGENELQALRARAYGPGGAPLTDADVERLARLERSRGGEGPRPLPATANDATSRDDGSREPTAPTPAGESAARNRTVTRVALITLAALVPAAALGGYFLGAFVQPQASDAAPTPTITYDTSTSNSEGALLQTSGSSGAATAASEDRLLDAQPGWDDAPRLLAATGETVVWAGTKARGAQTCLAIDVREAGPMIVCGATDEVEENGLSAEFSIAPVVVVSDEVESETEGAETEYIVDEADGPWAAVSVFANPYTGVMSISVEDADEPLQ